jgi:hypothetical protein
VTAALRALGAIGDERTARALEGLVWTLRRADARFAAIQTLVQLAGADANAALVRLWSRAADSLERSILVGHALANEGESSLALFELASFAEQPVRLQAALAIGQFRFPGFAALIAEWKGRETDAEVRAALGASEQALAQPARWSAERAAGPPDSDPEDDDPNAWASQKPDMGLQWLELGYDPPLRASGVRIFEVCVAGAVAEITAVDERGGRHQLWAGADPTSSPGVFELDFPATSFRVRALRLTLDTDRRPGWSEIDAVELLGPDGRAWATTASASSSYGR